MNNLDLKWVLLPVFSSVLVVNSPSIAAAVSVTLGAGNVGIESIDVTVAGTQITIVENWTALGNGFLEFNDLESGVNYTVRKIITNNTGTNWNSLANELLDPVGNGNDSSDVKPQPAFIPTGFSTSNDNDFLSFAQGFGLPRTSSIFNRVIADESTDSRDFLDFVDGTLLSGETDNFLTFSLRDDGNNQPFLLSQRPNATSNQPIPEPSTILGTGLLGFGLLSKRIRKLNKLPDK